MSQSQTDDEYGFVVIPYWVLRENWFESADQISLYIALANKQGTHGCCNLSLSQIAHDAMISRPSVIKNLKRLEEVGLVSCRHHEAEDGGLLSNEYYVSLYPTNKRKGL